jgi:CheY-like chemotaxis protein
MEEALAELQQSNAAAAWDGNAPAAVRRAPPAQPADVAFTPRPEPARAPARTGPHSSQEARRESPASTPASPPVKRAPRSKPVVYLVENPGTDRRATAELLEHEGFATRAAASGPEALEALAEGGIDLVLMSVDLPGMDGFDTTRILRSQAAPSVVPVVLIAPKLDRSAYAFGIQSGAADVIARPFHPQGLVELFKKLLRPAGYFPADQGPAPGPG